MFLTKKHLDRRTFLRGMGATVALPLLDAMIPARTLLAFTAARAVPRLAFVYFPHGAIMDEWCRRRAARPHPPTAVAVPRPADDRQRPRESPRLRTGARHHAGHMAVRASRRASAAPPSDQLAADHLGRRDAAAVDRCRHRGADEDRRRYLGRRVRRRAMARRSRSVERASRCRWNSARVRCSTRCFLDRRRRRSTQRSRPRR